MAKKGVQKNLKLPPAVAEDFDAELERIQETGTTIRPRDLAAAGVVLYLAMPPHVRRVARQAAGTYGEDKLAACQQICDAIAKAGPDAATARQAAQALVVRDEARPPSRKPHRRKPA